MLFQVGNPAPHCRDIAGQSCGFRETHRVLKHYTTQIVLSAASAQLQVRHLVATMPRFALFAGIAASAKVTLGSKAI